jgi:hypothetical protein
MSITGTSTSGINVSGLGGHGGEGGSPFAGVGGVGGAGGTGGAITVSLTGTTINASGRSAIGVQLYSAGGAGGGDGSAGHGGGGGAGGAGGAVQIGSGGSTTVTVSSGGPAVYLQSIGGSGGNGKGGTGGGGEGGAGGALSIGTTQSGSFTVSRYGALAECGAGGAGLGVQATGQTYFTIQPAIEFGGDLMVGGTLVRPNITIGLTQFIGSASPSVTASFLSAPGVAPFTVDSTFTTTYLDVGANIDIFVQGEMVLSLQGAGKFSSSTIGYGGGLKAALNF